jgi:putative transposase
MGRPRRVLVEGAVYHVSNRVARGEPAFGDADEAERFVAMLGDVKKQDGISVLAWCVMSNHYHLAVRMGSVPLSRTMQAMHQRFTRSFNGRHRVSGPFWQGRFKSRIVQDPRHLRQLILYIHSNPVAAGVVEDPAAHRWSGHGEVVRRRRGSLLDLDETLLVFGTTPRRARRSYLHAMGEAAEEPWFGASPGWLPWWRIGRPRQRDDEELTGAPGLPPVDTRGPSMAIERPLIGATRYLELGAEAAGLRAEELTSVTRDRDLKTTRDRLALVGVERYGIMVKEMAEVFGRSRETVSGWLSRATRRRAADDGFAKSMDELDRRIAQLAWRGSP